MDRASIMLERYPQLTIGIEYDSAMKCILAIAPKISSISFGSRYCQDYIQKQNKPVIVE